MWFDISGAGLEKYSGWVSIFTLLAPTHLLKSRKTQIQSTWIFLVKKSAGHFETGWPLRKSKA
jgi:hypothetical protein